LQFALVVVGLAVGATHWSQNLIASTVTHTLPGSVRLILTDPTITTLHGRAGTLSIGTLTCVTILDGTITLAVGLRPNALVAVRLVVGTTDGGVFCRADTRRAHASCSTVSTFLATGVLTTLFSGAGTCC